MNYDRRDLLRASLMMPIGLVVSGGMAACGSTPISVPPAVQKVAAYASAISGAFNSVVTSLGSLVGLSADTVTKIAGYATTIQSIAASLAATATTVAAAPLVTQIVGFVNATINALSGSGVALPAWVTSVLSAANTLVPIIEVLVGLLAHPRSVRGLTSMSETEAFQILINAAAR